MSCDKPSPRSAVGSVYNQLNVCSCSVKWGSVRKSEVAVVVHSSFLCIGVCTFKLRVRGSQSRQCFFLSLISLLFLYSLCARVYQAPALSLSSIALDSCAIPEPTRSAQPCPTGLGSIRAISEHLFSLLTLHHRISEIRHQSTHEQNPVQRDTKST